MEFEHLLSECGLEVIFKGSQNSSVVYAFAGNATNVFVCRKKGSSILLPANAKCVDDTEIGRMMANYDLGGYCMDYLPKATEAFVREVWTPAAASDVGLKNAFHQKIEENWRKYRPQEIGDNPNFTNVTKVLKAGNKLMADFLARHNNLYKISIMPTTYGQAFYGAIRLSLLDENKSCMACWVAENNEDKTAIRDGELLSFGFKEIVDSAQKEFTLLLEVLEIQKNSKLALYYNGDSDEGEFSLNGEKISHPLTYRLHFGF